MPRTITPTYVLLNQITLGAASASVTFSNIPQVYGDLVLVVTGTTTANSASAAIRLNGDTGSNYSYVKAEGTGSQALYNTYSSTAFSHNSNMGYSTTNPSTVICQIFDYAAADKHKTMFLTGSHHRADAPGVDMWAARWASTAAVTSVTYLVEQSTTYKIGSVFSLYGVHA